MTKARLGAVILVLAVFVAAAYAFSRGSSLAERADKPRLLLLTSLPLLFSEDFGLDQKGSAMLDALRSRYRVVPIDSTAPAALAKGRLLVMAQPRAQTAEQLVALDEWVRDGGRLLLFADPLLEWPSDKPLGDPTRPPPMFADTGLLAHWGLRLDAPDMRGSVAGKLGDKDVLTVSPGVLSGACALSGDGLVARCAIGKGKAVIVADADLLDLDSLDEKGAANGQAILAELDSLESR
ncbi:MAG: Gldg family protein [Sphingomicrobium sp.]